EGGEGAPAKVDHFVVGISTGRVAVEISGNAIPATRFSEDSKWYAASAADGLRLFSLEDGAIRTFPRARHFEFARDAEYFIVLQLGMGLNADTGVLSVISLAGEGDREMEDVSTVDVESKGEILAFVSHRLGAWTLQALKLGEPAGAPDVLMSSPSRLRLLSMDGSGFLALGEEDLVGGGGQRMSPVTHYFEIDEVSSRYRHYRHRHGAEGALVTGVSGHKWHLSAT